LSFCSSACFWGNACDLPERSTSAANRGDSSFFKGVQYLLSQDHDQAIEEFTKSVQVNSDTIETYVTLGNLYRSKGDIDRAIRIRQNIILRPNIDERSKSGRFSTWEKTTEKGAS
jgi:lipopolysaccharide biosynthesis regulator YciM